MPAPVRPIPADSRDLAELWFGLAAADDLRPLIPAFAASKAQFEAARMVMQRDPERYERFVQALLRGLADRRPPVRFECAHALDRFGDARCRGPLTALLDDPVPRVRWIAMHALTCHACGEGSVTNEPAVRERIAHAALHDPSPRVRRHAAEALRPRLTR